MARNHRRRARRKDAREAFERGTDVEDAAPAPDEEAAMAQAIRTLSRLLDTLDESKREVFVLAELEEMSAPEIAETLGLNVNTVYSRLRAARHAFDAAVERDTPRDASAPARVRGGRP